MDQVVPVSHCIICGAAFEVSVHVLEYSNAVFVVESFLRNVMEGWIKCCMHCWEDAAEVVVVSVDVIWSDIESPLIVNPLISFCIAMMIIIASDWLSPDAIANREQVHYVEDVFDCGPLDVAVFGLCGNLVSLDFVKVEVGCFLDGMLWKHPVSNLPSSDIVIVGHVLSRCKRVRRLCLHWRFSDRGSLVVDFL